MSELALPKTALDYIEDLRSIIYSLYPNIQTDDEVTFGHINKKKKSYGLLSLKSYPSSPNSLLYFHSFYGEDGPLSLINEYKDKLNKLIQMCEAHSELSRRVSRELYSKYDNFLKEKNTNFKNIRDNQQIFLFARNAINQLDDGNIVEYGKMKEQNIIKTLTSIVKSLNFEVENDIKNKKIEIFSSGQRACFELIIELNDSLDISTVKMSFAVDEDIFEDENINNEVYKLLKNKNFTLLKKKFLRLKSMENLIDEYENMHFEKSCDNIMKIVMNLPSYMNKVRVCEGVQINYISNHYMTFLGNEKNWRLNFIKNEKYFDHKNFIYLFELSPPIVIPLSKLLFLCLGENIVNEHKNISNNHDNLINGVTQLQAILENQNIKEKLFVSSSSSSSSSSSTTATTTTSAIATTTMNNNCLEFLTHVDHMNYRIQIPWKDNTCEECYIVSHLPLTSINHLTQTLMNMRHLVAFNQLLQSLFRSFDILDKNNNEQKNNNNYNNNLYELEFINSQQQVTIRELRYTAIININNDNNNDHLYDVELKFNSSNNPCSNAYATKVLSLSHSIPTMLHYINKSFL